MQLGDVEGVQVGAALEAPKGQIAEGQGDAVRLLFAVLHHMPVLVARAEHHSTEETIPHFVFSAGGAPEVCRVFLEFVCDDDVMRSKVRTVASRDHLHASHVSILSEQGSDEIL